MAVTFYVLLAYVLCANGLENPENGVIETILQRIEELEDRDRYQQVELDTLRAQNAQFQEREVQQNKRIAALEERKVQQNKRLAALEERERAMEKTTDELTAKLSVKEMSDAGTHSDHTSNESVQPEVKLNAINGVNETKQVHRVPEKTEQFEETKTIHRYTGENKDKVRSLPNHITTRQSSNGMTIAFYATLTDHMYHVGVHQAILFDNVITNAGHGYHTTAGIFTAPVSGIYVFSTTLLGSNTNSDYAFTVNGKRMSLMWVYAETNGYQTTSQTAIFDLNQGDDVSIRNNDADKMTHGQHYSTFSGFLLEAKNVDSQIVG